MIRDSRKTCVVVDSVGWNSVVADSAVVSRHLGYLVDFEMTH